MPNRLAVKLFVFVGFLLVSLSASARQDKEKISFKVEKFQLKNGLTVLVHEDSSRPIVSFQQWFRVGSSHEKPGRTGLAHFFEHLMFKGTQKYPKGIIDQILQANGGSNNAFTTEDYTGYYTNLPSDKLELIIDIESDRMTNLVFDIKEINSEREVVKEERRLRYENNNYGALFEKLRTTVYKTSPYRWPVIGYMADLNAATMDDFKEFYRLYYAPNNAVIVVAGNVKLSQVKKLIEKYYGKIPAQTLPAFDGKPEAEQKGYRESALIKDVQGQTIALSYVGVPAGHEDSYALDMLTSLLASDTSSRMHRRLVYKNQLATGTSSANQGKKLSGETQFFITLQPGADAVRAQALVDNEIAVIKKKPITDEELEKSKNSILLGYVRGLQTMHERAQALATNEIYFSDYTRLFSDLEKYNQVTKDDIQRVANKYLVNNKKTRVVLRANN